MNRLEIRRPDDFHAHVRQGPLLAQAVPMSNDFGRVLVMPNTVPHVLTAADAKAYREAIVDAGASFEPLMTISIAPSTTPEIVREASVHGVVAGKLYPDGVTTNSEGGVRDLADLEPVFRAMEECGLVLCLHGETPGVFVLDREAAFVETTLPWLVTSFPGLRIVLEHVTTAQAVDAVRAGPAHVGATITVHHLAITLDDVIGDRLEPHNFCKPVAKRPDDRAALVDAATSGDPAFFLGTDSAPHLQEAKECSGGAAGVFTAPLALAVLAEIFEARGALDRLEGFTSVHGADFYGLSPSEETVELVRHAWDVPASIDGLVPFRAGRTLGWQIVRDS
jgi:dihydroorotase